MNGLSLIVPIYNVQDYIKDCLSSIVTSIGNRENIQVILVDDGSMDGSGKIAQEFTDKYPNFQYVAKENGGLSDARNYGLQFVKYEYIGFIDSDDSISENYFYEIFKVMEEEPDLIVFDWMDNGENGYTNNISGMDLPDELWSVQPSAWNKIYRTNLFSTIRYPKGKVYEDVGTTYKILSLVSSFRYINKPLYNYRKNREGSILNTISPKINEIYPALEDTYSFYKLNNELVGINKEGLCYQYVKLLLWSNLYRQLKFYKFNFIGFYKKMKWTKELINKLFPDWKKNKFLIKNCGYFEERLGRGYIKQLDYIGKNFVSTLFVVTLLVFKNIKRY
ncbi:glycosyltransferase family 2 protein [Priestia endophytica]|uniref:glycosyltransferase family 2 protein n=1 Tax=Priestia endophytica TaxID=135735 RepID=UPI003D26C35D